MGLVSDEELHMASKSCPLFSQRQKGELGLGDGACLEEMEFEPRTLPKALAAQASDWEGLGTKVLGSGQGPQSSNKQYFASCHLLILVPMTSTQNTKTTDSSKGPPWDPESP